MIYILGILLLLTSCYGRDRDTVYEVDLAQDGDEYIPANDKDTTALRVAISTVISPRESFIYYEEMFAALSDHLGIGVDFVQRSSYAEVNDLLSKNQVDIAFICSGAYIEGSEHMELMFVPVVDGTTTYRGYIITQTNSAIQRFEDFYGRTFTYSDPMCFTGSMFVDNRLQQLGIDLDAFFGDVVYSFSHDLSMQMVRRRVVDGAAVNGLIFEYMRKHHPEMVADLRIVEKTIPGGIPPVVNSLLLPRNLREKIQAFFLQMHEQDDTREILDHLLIDQFVLGHDSIYDGLRDIQSSLQQ